MKWVPWEVNHDEGTYTDVAPIGKGCFVRVVAWDKEKGTSAGAALVFVPGLTLADFDVTQEP